MSRLENKKAIVTGAASGIGRAIADRFVAEGARVVYSDIVDPPESLPDGGVFKKCDVSSREAVDALVVESVEELGGLDIMVNNAGVGVTGGILDVTDEDWHKVMDINLSGVFYGLRAAAKHMKETGTRGSIINTSSILGRVGLAGALAYCASKGGVVQLTHAGALDLASFGIRVNAIAPGFIKTNMTKVVEESPEFMQLVQSNTPVGHMGSVADIAAAVLYLASDEAGFTTGEILYVDGGWTAH